MVKNKHVIRNIEDTYNIKRRNWSFFSEEKPAFKSRIMGQHPISINQNCINQRGGLEICTFSDASRHTQHLNTPKVWKIWQKVKGSGGLCISTPLDPASELTLGPLGSWIVMYVFMEKSVKAAAVQNYLRV